jgi:hypothetical protein
MKFETGKLYQITEMLLRDDDRWVKYWLRPAYALDDPNLWTNPKGERCVNRIVLDEQGEPLRREVFPGELFMFLGFLPGNQYHTQDFHYMHLLEGSTVWAWSAPLNQVVRCFGFKRVV